MKGLILNTEAEQTVESVVKDFETAVGSTLGPNGNYVIISSGTSSKVTKDGATVAKSIDYDDPFKAHIANIIREAAIKTETECGDGTTTTTLFACDYYSLLAKYNTYREHEIIRQLTDKVIDEVSKCEVDTEEAIRAAALISANRDISIADMVCDIVFENPGVTPDITLIEGGTNKDVIERIEGHRVAVTPVYLPDNFIKDKHDSQVRFIYIDQRLDNAAQFIELMQGFDVHFQANPNDCIYLFVMKNIDKSALAVDSVNHKNVFEPIKHRFGLLSANIGGGMSYELLEDMKAMTGGCSYHSIGEYVTIGGSLMYYGGNEYTVTPKFIQVNNLTNANIPSVNERIELIREELKGMVGSKLHTAYAGILRKRLASLASLHYIIHVGSETHSDFLERKDRFDDVITSAVTNTIYGVVPGFNTVFVNAMLALPELNMVLSKSEEQMNESDMLYFDFAKIFFKQTERLKNGVDTKNNVVNDLSTGEFIEIPLNSTNFGEDLMEAARQLKIYDPAYTVISALRGGFKTGQILAKTKSVVVSNRFASQML